MLKKDFPDTPVINTNESDLVESMNIIKNLDKIDAYSMSAFENDLMDIILDLCCLNDDSQDKFIELIKMHSHQATKDHRKMLLTQLGCAIMNHRMMLLRKIERAKGNRHDQ